MPASQPARYSNKGESVNKEALHDLRELALASGHRDPAYTIKLALLKIMADRDCYFDVADRLEYILNCFTFDRILSYWAGYPVKVYEEEEYTLVGSERDLARKFIFASPYSFEEEPETALGEAYEAVVATADKKAFGITYTPEGIREYMASFIRRQAEPDSRLLDPCCGAGSFLLAFYHACLNAYYEKGSTEPIKALHERILSECIYGIDSSPLAVCLSKISLALLYPEYTPAPNILLGDALVDGPDLFGDIRFDWVSTNPPYVGHKGLSIEYKAMLKECYPEVFFDKSDISYCFFSLAEKLLSEGGMLLFITSRYFAESLYGLKLRDFLLTHFAFEHVDDFYGVRPFKGTGIDPLILLARKGARAGNVFTARRLTSEKADLFDASEGALAFDVSQDAMSAEAFSFIPLEEIALKRRIEERTRLKLSDVMESFQGVITGCDRAFVASYKDSSAKAAIDECGLPWIKGKDLKRGLGTSGLALLYVDGTTILEAIPATIKRLTVYKDRLERRREVKNGKRRWFELQWPRKREVFEGPKLLFPYKAPANLFVYDADDHFFSADVYCMKPKAAYAEGLDMEKLAMLLSSRLYDSYFKTYAKKLGRDLYEYYPNTVMQMRIPSLEDLNGFESEEDIYVYFGLPAALEG